MRSFCGRAARATIRVSFLGILLSTPAVWGDSAAGTEPGRFEYLARVWDTDHGLPDYAVNSITQTPDGYLWLGTFEGLVRFDGWRFETVNHDTTPEFPGKFIRAVLLDHRGQLWTATDEGIACLFAGHWRTYREAGGKNLIATSMAEDGDGTMLAATGDRVLRLVREHFEAIPVPAEAGNQLFLQASRGDVWCHGERVLARIWQGQWHNVPLAAGTASAGVQGVGSSRDGGIWVAGANSIQKFRAGVWGPTMSLPADSHLTRNVRILEDSDGNLWVGDSLSGLFQFRPGGRVLRFTPLDGLSNPAIRALFEDRENDIWVGTHGGGLIRFKLREVQHFDEGQGLSEMMLDTVSEIDGKLLVATYGAGVVSFDENRMRFGIPTSPPGVSRFRNAFASSVIEDRTGALWVAVQHMGVYRFGPNGVEETPIPDLSDTPHALFLDSHGAVWVGTDGLNIFQDGKMTRYGTESGLPRATISSIAEDSQGEIWAGGKAGLFRFSSGRFEKYLPPDNHDFGAVVSLFGNRDGLWIGTESDGFYRLRGATLTSYGRAQGLPAARVTGMIEDDQHRLWLATFQNGLFCIPTASFDAVDAQKGRLLDLIWLRREDGLGSNQFRSGYQPAVWKGKDGRLWFATLKGLEMADPRRVHRDSMYPPVLVQAVSVNGQRIPIAPNRSTPLELPAGSRQLEFLYAAPSFADPEKIRFQYQLENVDSTWVDTTERSAVFGAVKPGKYTFRVKAASGDGVWNPTPASLILRVAPFFWETWWFRALGALSIATLSATVVYGAQTKKLRRKTEQLRIEHGLRLDVEKLQAVLKVSEEKFAKAFDASPTPLSIATLEDGRFVDVNSRFQEVTRLKRDEVIGRTFIELGLHDAARVTAKVRSAVAKGHVRNLDAEIHDRTGQIRHLIISAEVIELGGVPHLLVATDDVTERKHLEQQLNQAQKMESTGRLAGGIAHDFNNLLTVINGYSDLLVRRGELEGKSLERLHLIRQAGERAAELTRQLLAYSRKQVIAPKSLNLNAVVRETEAMLRRLLPENIEMDTRLDPSLGLVKADPGQMNQVLLNLALNARDAMPAGGRLIMETSNTQFDAEYAAVHAEVTPGPCVQLVVTDTGIGMDESVRAHIFEPFFTTKAPGIGTGLGLASAYGIVRQNHGWIWVYTEPGKGTTFKIYFPRLDSARVEVSGASPTSRTLLGTETILLVEDRHDVRSLAKEVLETSGYHVLSAANGAEAAQLARNYAEPIHLLLSDVVMPGMDGPALYEHLTAMRGPLKVLYMSGYTEHMIVHQAHLQTEGAFLEKPLTPEGLLAKVREALDGRLRAVVRRPA